MKYDSAISFLSTQNVLIKDIVILFVLGLLLNGCSSTKSVSLRSDSQESLDKINRSVSKRTSHIKLTSTKTFTGKGVHVEKDSTFWWDAETESTRYSVATSQIKSISSQKRNTLKGLGYGLLIGAATGASLGALAGADCDDDEEVCFPRSGLALVGTIAFGSVSGLIGLVSGALTKTTESYRFEQTDKNP